MVMKCTDCPIHQEGCLVNCMKGRGRFGGIMLVGEAPGAEEDKAGRVFVGRAGQLLDALLKDTGLAQYRIWKTNACRCRPAGNRTPKIDEVRACRKHLDREISIVKPEMIIALGRTPIQSLTDNHLASVRNYRAVRGEYKGIPVFYTYHPSAVLHDNGVLKHLTE